MSLKQKALFLAAGLLAFASAQAQVALTLDAGSTGAGAHVVVPMETYLNGRFGINYFKHDFDKRSGLVNYDVKAKLQTFDVLFDWYVRDGSAFHLTGGVLYNGTKADAHAKGDSLGKFTLHGTTYTAADVGVLNGRIDFRKAAPYLGIGWGNAVRAAGWSFGTDLGVMFQGTPKTQLASNNCTAVAIVCSQLASDVAAENVKLGEEVKDFKLYPVIRVGISYRF
jgi:hypothetical protein